jgi:hypothetical protein
MVLTQNDRRTRGESSVLLSSNMYGDILVLDACGSTCNMVASSACGFACEKCIVSLCIALLLVLVVVLTYITSICIALLRILWSDSQCIIYFLEKRGWCWQAVNCIWCTSEQSIYILRTFQHYIAPCGDD